MYHTCNPEATTTLNTASEPQEFPHRKRILASMSVTLLVIIASITSVNLALPEMTVDIGASFTDATWIADAYTVAIAAFVLPFGAVADKVGRKRMMLLGLALFAIVAVFTALQTSPGGVIAGRAGMGVAAAMIMPGTLATITATFPDEERARGVATWAGIAGAGAVFGLVTSGLLLEVWSWHSVFVFTGAMAIIAAIVVHKGAPETGGHHVRFDWIGSILSASGLGLLVWGIIDAGEAGWSDAKVLGAVFLSIALLATWVLYSLRVTDPLLDMRVFKNTRFTVGTIAVTSQFLAQFGFFFIAMQYLQLVLGYSPLRSAVSMFPLAIVVLPLSQIVPKLLKLIPVRIILPTGLFSLLAGLLILASMDTSSGYLHFAAGLMVLGAGVALTAPPATTAITEGLPREKQGTASAVNDVTRELGAALGIAIMGSMFTSAYRSTVSPLVENLSPMIAENVERAPAVGLQIADMMGPLGGTLREGVIQGFMDGTRASLGTVAIYLAVVAVTLAVVLFRDDRKKAADRETSAPPKIMAVQAPTQE